MTSTLWQAVRAGWRRLAGRLWPPTPEEQARDALAELDAELAWRYQRLVERRRRVEQLRDRLAHQQARAAELAGAALQAARTAAERTRQRLHAHEDGYRQARVLFDRRKQARRDLLRGALAPAPPET